MPGVRAVEPGVRGVDVPLRAERERADSERLVSVPGGELKSQGERRVRDEDGLGTMR